MKTPKKQDSDEASAYGKIEKEFRISKGYTLTDAASGYTTPSHLSEFENGKTMLSTLTFFGVLRNIHVTFSEFENRYNQYLHDTNVMMAAYEISEAFTERNVAKLKDILSKIQCAKSAQKDFVSLRLDEIRIKAAIKLIDTSFEISLHDINYLVKYLLNLKGWGRYEILLLGYTGKLIAPSDLEKLADRLLDPTMTNFNLPSIKLDVYRAILNIVDAFSEKKLYALANRYVQILKNDNIHDYFTYEKLILIYNEATLKFISGDREALETLKKCQETFAFCDCFNMANVLDYEITELEKKYK